MYSYRPNFHLQPALKGTIRTEESALVSLPTWGILLSSQCTFQGSEVVRFRDTSELSTPFKARQSQSRP